MNPNAGTLDELLNLARRRGSVSTQDLRQCLPIETMTAEDISHVLARLDEAGLDLEIDAMILLSGGRIAPEEQVSTPKREQAELLEPISKETKLSLPPTPGRSPTGHEPVRSSQAAVSAPMLPWVLAFVIVVLGFFLALAF